jgi:hypothetical protein
VSVGWGHRQTANDARPADPHVHPKAVEGLLEEGVLAEGCLSLKTPTAVGSGKQAHRQRQRIRQGEGGIVRGLSQEFLPEVLFDLPEVGCLPAEGGAMHLPQIRKEVGVVASEVGKELRVFIESQELSDDLDGEDFRVGECGSGSTCSEAPEVLDMVVYEAKDRDDKGARIRERKTSFSSRWIGAPPRVRRSSVLLKSSKKHAHGVN